MQESKFFDKLKHHIISRATSCWLILCGFVTWRLESSSDMKFNGITLGLSARRPFGLLPRFGKLIGLRSFPLR